MNETFSSYDSYVDEEIVVIEATGGWGTLRLNELWDYRNLLYYLAWRDVKVRYKQAALGGLWAVLQPVVMMLVFTLFLGRLASTISTTPYPLFVLTGLIPWSFFAHATTASSNSLVGNAHLVTKVYFPRLLVPLASVGAALVDFALTLVLLFGVLIYYGVRPRTSLLLLPIVMLLCMLVTIAIGIWLAALNVKYRDVRFVVPFALQIWLFASSVILPSTVISPRWRWMLALNPMSAIVEAFRSSLLGLSVDWPAMAVAALFAFLGLVCAVLYFRRVEREFADVI